MRVKASVYSTIGLFVSVAGCATEQTVTDPSKVARVIVSEDARNGHRQTPRYAVVDGAAAASLVRCMVYVKPGLFGPPDFAIGTKATGDAAIRSTDGEWIVVTLCHDECFFWHGPMGGLRPPFATLYQNLPWQPGTPPPAATQP